ncbi:MAG: carbohydrate-binding family 9-like protein, partial [Flavobacteriaceae bacterium]|nr:carbohydrate-binding family 9-like protein [Flavobacteriaceae bacterium]
YNWVWSPMGVINMHEPEKWGYVYFSTKYAGEKDTFEISNDEKIKWKLYELHRSLKKYYKTNKTFATSLDLIGNNTFSVEGILIKPILENHSQGYNLTVVSPFTNKQLSLREDGKFKIK